MSPDDFKTPHPSFPFTQTYIPVSYDRKNTDVHESCKATSLPLHPSMAKPNPGYIYVCVWLRLAVNFKLKDAVSNRKKIEETREIENFLEPSLASR